MLFLLDASAAGALSAILLLEGEVLFFLDAASGAVIFLLENGIRIDSLELGLEVTDGVAMGAAVRAAASIGKIVSVVLSFLAFAAPSQIGQRRAIKCIKDATDQFPLPPPSFFTFFGSASIWPDLAK